MAKKGNTYFTDKDFTDAEVLADPRFAFPCSFILRVGKSIVKETFYDVNGEKSVTTYQSSGDRILSIGDITATSNKAYLALPPELKNEVIINGDSYSRIVPQQFPYTPVVADQKILIIEAQPDADVFHLVEGLEAPEAVEPAYTGLFIARLIVTTTGVLVETGNSTYKQKQESDWRYVNITDASEPIKLALPFDTRGSFYLTKSPGVGIPTIAGIKKTSIAFAGDQYFYGGREGLIFNDTGGDVILNAAGVVDHSVFFISNRITPFTLKNNTGVKWKLRGSVIELLPSGSDPDLTEYAKQTDLYAEIVERAAQDLIEKNARIAADNAEALARANAITTEANARIAADKIETVVIALSPFNEDLTDNVSRLGFGVLTFPLKVLSFQTSAYPAPTGSGITTDLRKNGTSVATSVISAGATNSTGNPPPTFSADTFAIGDRLNFFTPTGGVGSTVKGQNLVATLKIERL